MCLIVDANAAHAFLAAGSAVGKWLLGPRGNPRLVVGGPLTAELAKLDEARKFLVVLQQAGRLRQMPPNPVEGASRALAKRKICCSNDLHVLVLAIMSGARTLATGDNALIRDFKNPQIIPKPPGKVYRNPAIHQRLLGHTSSCGVKAK